VFSGERINRPLTAGFAAGKSGLPAGPATLGSFARMDVQEARVVTPISRGAACSPIPPHVAHHSGESLGQTRWRCHAAGARGQGDIG
jgi:hypothetical protein